MDPKLLNFSSGGTVILEWLLAGCVGGGRVWVGGGGSGAWVDGGARVADDEGGGGG